ncbi:deoxyguanosinetriphosphate triphosphohydrolase [Taylorella equigenitalis]|uniref:deoxyguanosinetriphosphate triphosphohydrolase n=1 Tax=Taylorella equigenitalis TaxID=29575 RepID=UPI00040FC965|nr:deoxyguanosinetriphosphate triphosphohydrolase [Taylorella equigenitalis]WDU53272.1 deoxyguanosinetriphosphate triphosphohydrolase [Taylorella equigenitalis]
MLRFKSNEMAMIMTNSFCAHYLALYATKESDSKGRLHIVPEDPARGVFQRDRDRITHSTAFRRLEYKTQVFVNHEGDLFRTRLTHTLEVSQIARAIARQLHLNEDLVESIALAHDLGHTPFGHAGQDALNDCVKRYDPDGYGFEHNMHSLRIVDLLEERYADFPGLNLSFETRAGILKHCSRKNAQRLGDVAMRFLNDERPSLEAQVANVADGIAYNNHDIDDGVRSGLISLEQLQEVELFKDHFDVVMKEHPNLKGRRIISETTRRMINALIVDLVEQTQKNISNHAVQTAEDVIRAPFLVEFTPEMARKEQELRKFLMDNLYRHYKVLRMAYKAKTIITELFEVFMEEPRLLPPDYQKKGRDDLILSVTDYVAGMTDRFAIKEHKKIFNVSN